jgi:hypothetical protein
MVLKDSIKGYMQKKKKAVRSGRQIYGVGMGLHHWQCRDGGAQYKKKPSGKDSVIEGQPLVLFM